MTPYPTPLVETNGRVRHPWEFAEDSEVHV
jgi:hypothetical protein